MAKILDNDHMEENSNLLCDNNHDDSELCETLTGAPLVASSLRLEVISINGETITEYYAGDRMARQWG